MNKVFLAHAALFTVGLIYGGNYIIAKDVMNGGYLAPLGFILLRILTGSLLFTFIHQFWVKERIKCRKDWFRLAGCGLLGVTLNQAFFFSGLELTTPINASLIMTTTPVLVLVASALILQEPITGRKIMGILLGGTGAILLIAYGRQVSLAQESLLGDLMVFLNASFYGIYLVLVKPLMRKYHTITVVKWVFLFGLLFILPVGWPQLREATFHQFSPLVWLSIGYVLICTTVLAYLFNAYALSIVNPSLVSVYIYLQPFFAALFSILLQKDELTPIKWVAAALIFTGVFLVSRSSAKPIRASS